MDGIDAALIKTDGIHFIKDITNASLSYDKAFHHALKIAEYSARKYKGNLIKAEETYAFEIHNYVLDSLKLSPNDGDTIIKLICDYFGGAFPTFSQVIEHSTDLHAQLIENLLKTAEMNAHSIDVIGYHGQTLYHSPSEKITIQIGDGARLAERTGIPVVYQFRKNDVENGGQGAPFAPLYHQALAIRDHLAPVAIVNCGGISNVTFVLGGSEDDLLGFDTGPGNGLIDLYIKRKTQGRETFDEDGHYGLQGSFHPELKQVLFESLKDFLQHELRSLQEKREEIR
ncbi:anhydro-N-acetylmuramic acid kinase [Candidatus Bealeia paramacronuclearis]